MQHERINIWNGNEYSYSGAFGFMPNLHTYLHEDREPRPCVLVIPGGGYRMVVPPEGEIVAKCFYEKGYQAFVGTYTTNYLDLEPLKDQPLRDLSRMLRLILQFGDKGRAALDGGANLSQVLNLPVRERIGRAKYIREEELAEFNRIESELSSEMSALLAEGGR